MEMGAVWGGLAHRHRRNKILSGTWLKISISWIQSPNDHIHLNDHKLFTLLVPTSTLTLILLGSSSLFISQIHFLISILSARVLGPHYLKHLPSNFGFSSKLSSSLLWVKIWNINIAILFLIFSGYHLSL